jgi:(p)ppGpp synthase/HD superfamily hydrolase
MTAEELAKTWMVGTRKGSKRPAWKHPEDVVKVLARIGYTGERVVTVAWLHDALEDGRIAGRTMEIDDFFEHGVEPVAVCDVWWLTRKVSETKPEYLHRLRCASKTARIVKLADRLANLREGVKTMPVTWLAKYRAETREHVLPLADGLWDGAWFVKQLQAEIDRSPLAAARMKKR